MKNKIIGLSLLVLSVLAHAQFIDERMSPGDTSLYEMQAKTPVFDVRPNDQTIRDVLIRWSGYAGWVHKPEHWTLDRDFPIAGPADASMFGTDFKQATRKLLSSTELTDRPVQPCFYTNRVLRVIPKAELCDKTSSAN